MPGISGQAPEVELQFRKGNDVEESMKNATYCIDPKTLDPKVIRMNAEPGPFCYTVELNGETMVSRYTLLGAERFVDRVKAGEIKVRTTGASGR